MYFKSSCLFLAIALCLATLFGCSRESSIRENVSLRNNHSVVFAFNKPFEDADAFADSIINLSNPDSVLTYDTVTVTVNDTVYLMGFLRYNSDKIYRYIWHFEQPYHSDSKDTLKKDCEFYFNGNTEKGCNYVTENSSNAKAHFRVYPDTGLYCPLFIAIDGNNARDTAGIGQYIRVINTAPYLSVPKDTLWTRAKGSITFPIVATDSFGTIKSLKIDPDASGKAEPKDLKFKKMDDDSLEVTVKFDSAYVDSLGNQKIYIIAIDEDDNETKDSVNLHFNQLPKLKLVSPEDSSTQDENKRLILHFEATDLDNPAALRYYVRAANPIQSDTSTEEFVPNFTDRYLVAENLKEPYFVAVDADGKNNLGVSGRVYWDVWVTDGYDTVYADKIKNKDKTTRPRTFLLIDLKNPYGVFRGYVKYQGMSHHNGIFVTLQDSVNKYPVVTNEKGYFSVNVPAGSFRLYASDTSSYGFAPESLSYRHIELGQTINLGNIVLRDTIRPSITIDNPVDTLRSRAYQFSGKASDQGSQVKTVKVWFDGEEKEIDFFGGYNAETKLWTWLMPFDDLEDGPHNLKFLAQDSAGLESDTLDASFIVDATSIHIAVNNNTTALLDDESAFTFTAEASETSAADSLTWVSDAPGFKSISHKMKAFKDTLKFKNGAEIGTLEGGKFYEMYAMTPSGVKSNVVRFGILSNDPVIYFEKPESDTSITINDEITFSVFFFAGKGGTGVPTVKTSGDGFSRNLDEVTIVSQQNETVSWSKVGKKKIFVSFKNGTVEVKDSLVVNVVEDLPKIKILSDDAGKKKKINSGSEITFTATDKYGTVQKIEWGCTNGATVLAYDPLTITPGDTVKGAVSVVLPGEATKSFKCVFKATDDDGETSADSLFFETILDKPYISINIKQQTLTINDEANIAFFAKDTLGTLVKFQKSCSRMKEGLGEVWKDFTGFSVKEFMPTTDGKYYCAIKITDDDNNSVQDTVTFNVVRGAPSVTVMNVSDVTIKDEIHLDADAQDSIQPGVFDGYITKYEWGCGLPNTNITFTYSSRESPEYTTNVPSEATNNYLCIIRVTDDDGNTALDTAHINVILDPPTVTVKRESATVREGFNITLGARASDGYGDIVKKEWSCGTNSEVESNWKTVNNLDTTWKAPAASLNFMCIVRVTDDDGNTARDTMKIDFSTETPVLTVTDEVIYVAPGQPFELSAHKNDNVWKDDNVSWYKWQCFYKSNDKAIDDEILYSFTDNFIIHDDDTTKFFINRDESFTEKGEDIYCVVTAEETSTELQLSDTTQIVIIKNPPKGVITAADTVFLWSGDETVPDESRYFYTNEWGGMNSTMGPIGDINNQKFNWSFSNVDDGYYEGNKNGTIDTTIKQFNEAFIRNTSESSITICLDYRDSSTTHNSEAFYMRHRAEEVCRKVYFRKAWKNLVTDSKDTVLETAKFSTAPALATFNNKPVIAYLTGNTQVTTAYLDGNTWKNLSTTGITATDSITSLKFAVDGNNLYLAVLSNDNKLNVYKSASGTSAWATLGSTFENASFVSLGSNPTSNQPAVTYIETTTKAPMLAHWNGSAWESEDVPTPQKSNGFTTSNCVTKNRKKVCDTTYKYINIKTREMQSQFMDDGKLAIIFVDTTAAYQAYYLLMNSSYSILKKDEKIAENVNGISLAADGSNLYMGFLNRDTEKYGPYVYKGSVGSSSISWTTSGSAFGQSLSAGRMAYHIHIAASNGKLFAVIDDNGRFYLAQSHVFQLDGNVWKLYGENELPYSKVNFFERKKYYLRGTFPMVSISENGSVYVSILAWENAGGSGKNYGPIVMKYVADSWTVH